jgi:uncharacterized protein affecting Mg2+/Co2+ transport
MKYIYQYILISILLIAINANSQISLTNSPSVEIPGSSVFLDASTNFSSEGGAPNNVGKGIIIPSVDLVNFQFELALADGITFPTYFDGMVVYNRSSGTTLTTGNRPSAATAVTPGFYYFSNPNGAANGTVTAGIWTLFVTGSTTKDVTSSEVVLPTKVNGAQLYAINGTFTASGTSTAITVTKPTGMTGYYSMVTYKDGKTFRREIYSFDTALATLNVITGTGAYSEVLPAGTYSYVLEYFK